MSIKGCDWLPLPWFWHLLEILEILLLHVLSNDGHKFVIKLFPISWESFENVHLLHFLYCKCRFEMAVMHLILQEPPYKIWMQNLHFWVGHHKLWLIAPPLFWHLVEILEILLLHVLSNDGHKFIINLFPISWEAFKNAHLLHFLLLMEIWNGCNALNIAGNPIQDINAKVTFLSWASKVVIDFPSFDICWRYWKFYFCMYSPMMDTNLS